jgi:transcriptional regulator with XRE-family HTH domain
MTLEDYRRSIGWSKSELARQAGLDYNTANRALKGELISARTANAIATALSRALSQTVLVSQIEGLNVAY